MTFYDHLLKEHVKLKQNKTQNLTPQQIYQIYCQMMQDLGRQLPEWYFYIENGSLVICLNWKNPYYYADTGITTAMKTFRYVVTVNADGTFCSRIFCFSGPTLGYSRMFQGDPGHIIQKCMAPGIDPSGKSVLKPCNWDSNAIHFAAIDYLMNKGLSYYRAKYHFMGIGFLLAFALFFLTTFFITLFVARELPALPLISLPFGILGAIFLLLSRKQISPLSP